MTYPTFNIPYKKAYSSSIRFETQVNQKELGREQRYPKKVYPIRTFTLKFEKNPAGRQQLEDFFTEVCGSYGLFNWTWETSRGGTGQTYLCWFDVDHFVQNIDRQEYTECDLKIITIDRNVVVPPANFNFHSIAKTKFGIKFYTIMDKVITAQNSRRKMWDSPKKNFTLSFEKNEVTKRKIENYFISKRGKFRAFEWTWNGTGGDGQTYWVRFDNDELVFNNYDGYMTCEVQLQEVFRPILTGDEYDKDEIIPRRLIKVDIPSNTIRIIDNDTLESLTYEGENYLGAPLEIGSMELNDNTEVSKLPITISNVNQGISAILGNYGDIITGCPVYVYQILLNTSTFTLIEGSELPLFVGKANNLVVTSESLKFDVASVLGGFDKTLPRMTYGVNCQWLAFKDCMCGYTGPQTRCDRTQATCDRYGNIENFGGFPNLPSEQVIKAR